MSLRIVKTVKQNFICSHKLHTHIMAVVLPEMFGEVQEDVCMKCGKGFNRRFVYYISEESQDMHEIFPDMKFI